MKGAMVTHTQLFNSFYVLKFLFCAVSLHFHGIVKSQCSEQAAVFSILVSQDTFKVILNDSDARTSACKCFVC